MPSKPIFGFYSSWATYRSGKGQCSVENIDPNLCTHLLYAFALLDSNGSIVLKDHGDRDAMRRFNALRDTRNPRLRTLVSIGGARDCAPAFQCVAASSHLRAAFARNVRKFCTTNGFNGVDIDWEFPESSTDRNNFVHLLAALSAQLKGNGLLLTTSVGVNREYDWTGVAKYVDYILLMSYDYIGSWDPYTGHNAPLFSGRVETDYQKENLNVKASVGNWIRGGAPWTKLIVGLAAYGRTFTLRDTGNHDVRAGASGAGRAGPYTKENGTLAYYEIKEAFGQRYWDVDQHVPYAVNGDQWVSYDDPESIRKKCYYINTEGLGGAMIWSIDMDEFQDGKFTLLRTVVQHF
ncbi:chitotriosidase-1-like [Anopheles maculipalpis]|uniref:chitotriosidase-1-like n=1 Tax=Anopheles maculipalpis TaxID=1496333 RepID=UPI002158AA47|nr:chitotriosidase-1-like [Anopheles maculipalpis]